MDLQDYMRVFRARWVAIVLITALGGAAAFGWTLTQSKVYTATGSAIITTGASEDLGSALVGDNYAKSRVKSYLDIAKSRKVAEYAIEDLGLDSSPDTLVSRVTVSNPLDTAVLRVAANGSSPEEARDLVEAWISGMTKAVADIENSGAEDGDTQSVVGLQTLDSAVLPGAPSSPNVNLAVALGLLVGLALGIAYSLVKATLDRLLRKPEDVEREFDIPVLGALPFDDAIARSGVALGPSDFAMTEAIRQVRTNLQFMDVDNPPRVIVVTSSLPGDGKSTSIIKLADAIAESGRDVVLIDADLRRPSVAKNLGLVEGAGLTDVLVGRARAQDVLQSYGSTDHFYVMAAGAIPPNPSELLASDAMHKLLYSFPAGAIVLIDTPPLIPVTDAAVLTARTDGALVVARSGKTTIDLLDRALQNLDRVNGRALGIIVDAMPRKGAHKDAYAYDYTAGDDRKHGKNDGAASVPATPQHAVARRGKHYDALSLPGCDEIVEPVDRPRA
ncbi:polysaccharide biosynthesis tyrosine autokinase [Demequina sp. SYSU T00192]|uniref:Polysaccharide biosynthesis tyrosine autokinase n=1 Tax=Demequina litoralis TaxID=3051660 RepID=A0ABT8G8V6_9MICO|nr:polysaccharide biosynthesis tyrosine autokinase [Demequina sp. SYSU T00192]MDN4475432.1 polysaccharide biosynthesis tyrosine autokinase [Demequina sp. SYSU T00192]